MSAPACGTECAPCFFGGQYITVEPPFTVTSVETLTLTTLYPVVSIGADGLSTTYSTSTVIAPFPTEDSDNDFRWSTSVDGYRDLTFTGETSYALYTAFEGAAPTRPTSYGNMDWNNTCASRDALSSIDLPATVNPQALAYPLPANGTWTATDIVPSPILSYLESLETVTAQLQRNELMTCLPTTEPILTASCSPIPPGCPPPPTTVTTTVYGTVTVTLPPETITVNSSNTAQHKRAREENSKPRQYDYLTSVSASSYPYPGPTGTISCPSTRTITETQSTTVIWVPPTITVTSKTPRNSVNGGGRSIGPDIVANPPAQSTPEPTSQTHGQGQPQPQPQSTPQVTPPTAPSNPQPMPAPTQASTPGGSSQGSQPGPSQSSTPEGGALQPQSQPTQQISPDETTEGTPGVFPTNTLEVTQGELPGGASQGTVQESTQEAAQETAQGSVEEIGQETPPETATEPGAEHPTAGLDGTGMGSYIMSGISPTQSSGTTSGNTTSSSSETPATYTSDAVRPGTKFILSLFGLGLRAVMNL